MSPAFPTIEGDFWRREILFFPVEQPGSVISRRDFDERWGPIGGMNKTAGEGRRNISPKRLSQLGSGDGSFLRFFQSLDRSLEGISAIFKSKVHCNVEDCEELL